MRDKISLIRGCHDGDPPPLKLSYLISPTASFTPSLKAAPSTLAENGYPKPDLSKTCPSKSAWWKIVSWSPRRTPTSYGAALKAWASRTSISAKWRHGWKPFPARWTIAEIFRRLTGVNRAGNSNDNCSPGERSDSRGLRGKYMKSVLQLCAKGRHQLMLIVVK